MDDGNWSLGAGLAGRGVMVTGAAGGIGSAVARAFAAVGARVAAVDRDADAVDDVVAGLAGDGHATLAVDLRDAGTHPELVHRAATAVGPLRALAHTAAVIVRRATPADVSEEDWDLQHDVNLRSTFFLARAVAEHMRRAGGEERGVGSGGPGGPAGAGGRIVTFTSQAWWTGGLDGSLAYAASKGGVVSLTRGLARRYASDGITVNTIAPGAVDTPMLTDDQTPEALERFAAQIPLGRFARPDEIAGTVIFLCSDHAAYVTGATLNLTGGQLMY